MLFDRYDGQPGLTAEVMEDGWFLTSDLGRLDDDGRLQVLGRADDVVVSGGVKVPGPAVARRLREHPRIQAAEVVGVPDAEWGRRVVAVVVSPSGTPARNVRPWTTCATGSPRSTRVSGRPASWSGSRNPAAAQRQGRPARARAGRRRGDRPP